MRLQLHDRPAWLGLATLGALAFLGFTAAAAADGRLFRLGETDAWRDLSPPVLIIYLLAIQPLLKRRRQEVATAFARVLPVEVTAHLKVDEPSPRSRGALLAIATAVAVVVMEDGWFTYPIADSWLNAYSHLIRLVMFGLIGWTVYRASEGTRLAIRLQRSIGTLNLFGLDFLDSVGRQSSSVLLMFFGGISLSLLFVPVQALTAPWNLVIYPVLVLLMLGLFIASLWSTHQLVARVKRDELVHVRRRLSEAYTAWREERAGTAPRVSTEALAAWMAWEHRLLETPEWPWHAGLLRGLGVSMLAPLLALAVRLLFGYVV